MADNNGRLTDSMSQAADSAERMRDATAESVKNLERIAQLSGGISGSTPTSGGFQGANARANSSFTGGIGVGTGNIPVTQGVQPLTNSFQDVNVRDSTTATRWEKLAGNSSIRGAAGSFGSAVALALPSGNEALNVSLAASRLRFYGATSTMYGSGGAFDIQQRMSAYGTPTSALDAITAANFGAGAGLLPGLSNYGGMTPSNPYGSILGSAALASNLTPGLGLTGGMGVMSSMNQARNVNMLRMMGVSVRNSDGTSMNSLGGIINRVYQILKHANGGKNPTKQEIAVSAMSGNALDSLLNQYFPDPNVRQTVLVGLIQMAATGGMDLNASGDPRLLAQTGATIGTVGSIGRRNTAELSMIQSFSDSTLKGVNIGNNVVTSLLGALTSAGQMQGLDLFLQGGAGGIAAMETIGGARGGAGALLMDAAKTGATGIFDALKGAAGLGAGGNAIVNALMGAAATLGVGAFGQTLASHSFAANMSPFTPGAQSAWGHKTVIVNAVTNDATTLGNQIAQSINASPYS